MEKAIVKRLNGSYRYFVVSCESGSYLIDTDRFWLGYLFPLLNYFLPVKAMKLTKELPKYLIQKEDSGSGKGFLLSILGVMLFQHLILTPLLTTLSSEIGFNQGVIILLSTTIMIVFLKVLSSILSRRRLLNYVDFKGIKRNRIIIRPTLVRLYISALILPIMFVGPTILSAYGYLSYGGDLVALAAFFILGLATSIVNWLSFPHTNSNLKDYYMVKFIEN